VCYLASEGNGGKCSTFVNCWRNCGVRLESPLHAVLWYWSFHVQSFVYPDNLNTGFSWQGCVLVLCYDNTTICTSWKSVCLNEFAIQPVAEGIEISLMLNYLQLIYWSDDDDDDEWYDHLTVSVNHLENDVITWQYMWTIWRMIWSLDFRCEQSQKWCHHLTVCANHLKNDMITWQHMWTVGILMWSQCMWTLQEKWCSWVGRDENWFFCHGRNFHNLLYQKSSHVYILGTFHLLMIHAWS
jgi:hypothetical protein